MEAGSIPFQESGSLLKILFIHEVSYRKKVIFEMHEFPELLALRGHEVSFLEFDEGRKFWKKSRVPRFELIKGRVHGSADIKLFRPFQIGIPGVDRILALATVVPTLRKLLRENRFDVVVLYAVPTFGLQTLWLAKRFNVPVVFRALDVSHRIRSSVVAPAIKWVEGKIYRHVDLLSANNPAMADYCAGLGKRTKPKKVHFPPLELSHFRVQGGREELRRSIGLNRDDRVLVYMGSFFYFSGLVNAVDEFAEVSRTSPNLRFLLVGGGEQGSELREKVASLGLREKVIFTGFVSYQDLPRYLKIADVAVNTLEPTLVANVAFPNKVLQYMAAGLPVVSTKLDGLYSVFDNQTGIVWAQDARAVIREASSIARKKIVSLATSSPELINPALSSFDPAIAAEKFEASLTALVRVGTR